MASASFVISRDLVKRSVMPDNRFFKLSDGETTIEGDLVSYTRIKGWLLSSRSKVDRRHCALTPSGFLLIWMEHTKGFVLRLSDAIEVSTETENVRVKAGEVRRECRIKIHFSFGTVNLALVGDTNMVRTWRDGIVTGVENRKNAKKDSCLVGPSDKHASPRSITPYLEQNENVAPYAVKSPIGNQFESNIREGEEKNEDAGVSDNTGKPGLEKQENGCPLHKSPSSLTLPLMQQHIEEKHLLPITTTSSSLAPLSNGDKSVAPCKKKSALLSDERRLSLRKRRLRVAFDLSPSVLMINLSSPSPSFPLGLSISIPSSTAISSPPLRSSAPSAPSKEPPASLEDAFNKSLARLSSLSVSLFVLLSQHAPSASVREKQAEYNDEVDKNLCLLRGDEGHSA